MLTRVHLLSSAEYLPFDRSELALAAPWAETKDVKWYNGLDAEPQRHGVWKESLLEVAIHKEKVRLAQKQ
jgi:hypothetical protein